MVFWIIFGVMAAVSSAIVIPQYVNHYRVTGGTRNYNATMSRFIYRVNAAPDEIISSLVKRDAGDDLECRKCDGGTVEFSYFGSSMKYLYMIEDRGEYSVLRLERANRIAMQSSIPLLLNPFIVSKLDAEPMPISEY